jgi:vitamin B12 transporter
MHRQSTVIVPACLLVAAVTAAAQSPDTTALGRVVITATRVSEPLGAGLVGTTVIDRAMLERTGVRDAAEALRLVPGVSIARSGGPGAQTSIFLRGGENDYVRVLVDGVPVNDPGGAVDLGWLSLDDIDRIEVVRGPTSVLYGTDAVNGVVQLFTRRATRSGAEVAVTTGRYGALSSHGAVSWGDPSSGLRIGVARDRTDGILALNNEYERSVLSATAHAKPLQGTRTSFALRHVDDEFHYPTDGSGGFDDANAFRRGRRLVASAALDQQVTSRIRTEVGFSAMNARGRDDDRADSPADTLGGYHYDALTTVRRRVLDGRVHVLVTPAMVLTLGADLTRESQRGNDSSNYSFSRSTFSEERRTEAAFVQWLADVGPFSLVAGGRYDDNDTYGVFRTGRVGAAWKVWSGGQVRANVATAFKAPTFLETFNTAFSIGNPDLEPERSRSWEVGLTQVAREGRLTMAATWFHQRYRDMIQYGFVSPDEPNYFNVAAAFARGIELEVTGRPTDRLRTGLSGTFLTTRVEDAGLQSGEGATFVQGERLLRRPSAVMTAMLGYDHRGGASADVLVRRTGTRDDRDFSTFPATPVTLPAYTMVDLAFTSPFAAGWTGADLEVTVRLENALNSGYQEVMHYPSAGRGLFLGLRAAIR